MPNDHRWWEPHAAVVSEECARRTRSDITLGDLLSLAMNGSESSHLAALLFCSERQQQGVIRPSLRNGPAESDQQAIR
jgi:hypothetical protein